MKEIKITIPQSEVYRIKDFAIKSFGVEVSDLMVIHFDLDDAVTPLYRSQVDTSVDYYVSDDSPVIVEFDVVNGSPHFSGWMGRILARVIHSDNGDIEVSHMELAVFKQDNNNESN